MMDLRCLESVLFFNVFCVFCLFKLIFWNRVVLFIIDCKIIKGENEIWWEKEEKRSFDLLENSYMYEMNKV